ncbi:MAG: hypothetical protein AAGB28_12780, partial [Pseudomonadota bacterium]
RDIDFSAKIWNGFSTCADGAGWNGDAFILINQAIHALSFPNKSPMLGSTTFEDDPCRKISTMET